MSLEWNGVMLDVGGLAGLFCRMGREGRGVLGSGEEIRGNLIVIEAEAA